MNKIILQLKIIIYFHSTEIMGIIWKEQWWYLKVVHQMMILT